MTDVLVVGAGLAGLSAAHRLQQLGADVRVVERSAVAGGHVRTIVRDGWRCEWGPNSFLGGAAALHGLSAELGLVPVEARAAAKKRYLFLDGKLQALPASPAEALTSPLLPASAKLRLLAEPLQRTKPRDDETVREFFEKRLGREVTDRFVDAFVSGIYAGDISTIGVAAAFPKLVALVREHGSLAQGAVAAMRASSGPAKRGTFSFDGGLGTLATTLAAKLGGRLELSADYAVRRTARGWSVGPHEAPELVISAPAPAAAKLLADDAPALSQELTGVSYAPMTGVHLLFPADALRAPFDGFGFLIPRREGVRMLGCVWSSALFDVATGGRLALTCFIGGAHDPEAIALSDDALISEVRRDLRRTMGLEAAPLDRVVVKHAHAIPQYGVRHLAWRARVEALVAAQPGLSLVGNHLEGVSMNDTVTQADRVARAVHARLAASARAA
jgi:oxygen-dependent protoporphyrinogen oxidase